MLKQIRHIAGQSVTEYMLLIVFILTAFFVMQKYIVRGFSGRWKDIGDSLGQGRLYDANKTIECAYDFQHYNMWYSVDKFEENHCGEVCYFDKEFVDDASKLAREEECRDCICQSQQFPECEKTKKLECVF